MEFQKPESILDDRRIKLLNFLLDKHEIPEYGTFNIAHLLQQIDHEELKEVFKGSTEFEEMWQNVDLAASLSRFLVENGLAKETNGNLQLTVARGRSLKQQGSYDRLLADERFIASEARRVTELEKEADRTAHRQYKINFVIAFGTSIAAIYYILEILNGFIGFYKYGH